MPDFNTEIMNVPVGQIMGATIESLIEGQYSASLKSLELFQQVAYDSTGAINTLEFKFNRANPDYDPAASNPQPSIATSVNVPTAMLINYANMSIDYADIEFNVDLASTEYSSTDITNSASASLEFRARLGWWGSLAIKGKVAHQKKTLSGVEVKRNYGLNVKAHVVREAPPPALEKVFGLMLEGIV